LEIGSAPLTQQVGIVCGRAYTDRARGSRKHIT
jgi:hypothetical protein